MKTKKLIAGLISAATIASISVSAIASAADSFSVKISSAEVEAGEEFTLTMDLADIPKEGINGCEFGISFDPSVVTNLSVELGDLAKDATSAEDGLPSPLEVNVEKDVISLMYALGTTDSKYYMTGSGTFLKITGEVKDTAKAGDTSEFKVVPVDRAVTPGSSTTNTDIVFGYMSDDDKITKYDPTFTSGTVTVKGGDVTTDPTDDNTDPTDDTKPTTQKTTKPTTSGSDSTEPTKDTGDNMPTESDGSTKPSTSKTTKGSTTKATQVSKDIPDGENYGDVNLDGTVNVADVVALNLFILNPEKNAIGDKGEANADCKRDNIIDTSDSTRLMNYVAEIIKIDQLGKK